jgi:hypothetical protein
MQPGTRVDRRMVLKGASVLGGAAAATLAGASRVLAEDDEGAQTLVGGWMGTTNAGPPFGPFKALYTFAAGGGLVTSNSIDLSPRSLSTPGYGSWARRGPRTFAFTFDAFVFDPQGNPAGTVEARTTVTLNQAGDAFSGPFNFDVIAPNGAIVFSGSGTHQAERIRVKPL